MRKFNRLIIIVLACILLSASSTAFEVRADSRECTSLKEPLEKCGAALIHFEFVTDIKASLSGSLKSSTDDPAALIVDYETKDARRVKKMMESCGFTVFRTEQYDEIDPDNYDCLVIPGGHNITPSIYGEERDEHTYGTNEEKDLLQIEAVKRFKEAEKPILGVCRGEQLVNVALGGTIYQHIGWHKGYRDITVTEGTWIYDLFGETVSVKHSHHQCVKELGDGLTATQWDVDSGYIEGYQHEELPIYGLQWHPDHMGVTGKKVFEAFRDICMEWNSK